MVEQASFLVSTSHLLPKLSFKRLPVLINEQRDARNGRTLYEACAVGIGCGGPCASPQQAIKWLFSQRGCDIVEVVNA
jgi:hypothetical protein